MRRRPDAYRGQVARTTSISSPVAGLNARDSIAAMNVKNAVLMENLWPEANSVRVRKGSSNWTTGITGQVQTMMAYAPRSGVAQFYGITTGGNIYNVSAAGAVGAAVVSGLTNGQWQYIQSTNSAGAAFLTLCNGVDTVRQYDGGVDRARDHWPFGNERACQHHDAHESHLVRREEHDDRVVPRNERDHGCRHRIPAWAPLCARRVAHGDGDMDLRLGQRRRGQPCHHHDRGRN